MNRNRTTARFVEVPGDDMQYPVEVATPSGTVTCGWTDDIPGSIRASLVEAMDTVGVHCYFRRRKSQHHNVHLAIFSKTPVSPAGRKAAFDCVEEG